MNTGCLPLEFQRSPPEADVDAHRTTPQYGSCATGKRRRSRQACRQTDPPYDSSATTSSATTYRLNGNVASSPTDTIREVAAPSVTTSRGDRIFDLALISPSTIADLPPGRVQRRRAKPTLPLIRTGDAKCHDEIDAPRDTVIFEQRIEQPSPLSGDVVDLVGDRRPCAVNCPQRSFLGGVDNATDHRRADRNYDDNRSKRTVDRPHPSSSNIEISDESASGELDTPVLGAASVEATVCDRLAVHNGRSRGDRSCLNLDGDKRQAMLAVSSSGRHGSGSSSTDENDDHTPGDCASVNTTMLQTLIDANGVNDRVQIDSIGYHGNERSRTDADDATVAVISATPSSGSTTALPHNIQSVDAAGGFVQICINDVSVDDDEEIDSDNSGGEPKSPSVNHSDTPSTDETNTSPDVPTIGLLSELRSPQRNRSRSVIELVSEHGMLEQLDNITKKYKAKEEKPSTRDKVLSKISSYRQKWITEKTAKSFKNTHQFVPVSFSNSTSCDVCSKPLSNKAALQCENCTVNVHEHSCKDLTTMCPRINKNALASAQSMKDRKGHTSSPTGSPSLLRGSQSLRENLLTGPLSLQVKISDDSGSLGKQSNAISGISSIDDAHSGDDVVDGFTLHTASLESMELNSKVSDLADDEEDLNLLPKDDDSQPWDTEVLKQMDKWQHHICEFIQTEKRHYRTLKIMKKIFAQNMVNHVGLSTCTVDQLFPSLDALVEIHRIFLRSFNQCQSIGFDRCSIEEFCNLLIQQFDGQMGIRMKKAYGDFCSRHLEALTFYKELLKNDRRFKNFIGKCRDNSLCNRNGIPEHILLVTQRCTKYLMIIESIIKSTTDLNARESDLLSRSLSLIRGILRFIDRQIASRQKELRLADIYRRIDSKACTTFRGGKFQKSDLLANKRKLLHETPIKWKLADGKLANVIAVILSDVMVFLTEYNQKYAFFSQDKKTSVFSLSQLLVREKGDTKDSKSVYFFCTSKTEPDMIELVCRTKEEQQRWISILRDAIFKRPREDSTGRLIDSEDDELLCEQQATKLGNYIDELHEKDRLIRTTCDEKIKVIQDILDAASGRDKPSWRCEADDESPDNLPLCSLLQRVTRTETQLLESLYMSNSTTDSDFYSGDCAKDEVLRPSLLSQPKRADTFSGFDCRPKSAVVVRHRYSSGQNEDGETGGSRESLENEAQTSAGNQLGISLSVSNNRTQRRASISVITTTVDEDAENNVEDTRGRRMSANLEQSLHGCPATSVVNDADANSDDVRSFRRPSRQEHSATPNSTPAVQLSARQTELLSALLQHVHTLGECALEKSTEMECVRAQLAEARCSIAKLSAENERLSHERRPGGHHLDKQLEDLRQLQSNIQQEREELRRVKELQEVELIQEREAQRISKVVLDRQKAEILAQKDELQRQRDVLQRQIDLFNEQRRLLALTTNARQGTGSADRRGSSPHTASDRANVNRSKSPLIRTQSGTCSEQQGQLVDESPTTASGCRTINAPLLVASSVSEGRLLPRTESAGSLVCEGVPHRLESQPIPMNLLSMTNQSKQICAIPDTDKVPAVRQVIPKKLSSSAVVSSSSFQSIPSMSATGQPDRLTESGVVIASTTTSSHEATRRSQHPPNPQQAPTKRSGAITVNSLPTKSHGGNIIPMKLAESRAGNKKNGSSKSSFSSSSSPNGSGTLSPVTSASPTIGRPHHAPRDLVSAAAGAAISGGDGQATAEESPRVIYFV